MDKKVKYALFGIAAVIIVLIGIIFLKSPTTQNLNAPDALAPSTLVHEVTSVSSAIFQEVGIGSSTPLPRPLPSSSTPLTQNNKPTFLYMGAEYCPYCATERWAMVVALSQFGTFSNLKTTHSSSTDVFPDTQTFSFYGSSFSSNYLNFIPVEMYTNVPSGNGYTTLQTPTSQQQQIMNTYDAPPYVASSSQGSIPFMYFNGKYFNTGATYSPSLLEGKTALGIASSLTNPKDPVTKGMVGAANGITAAICGMTNNQPTNICSQPYVQNILRNIDSQ